MLVFVDESGDPGLKLGQGSSTHFVVALIIFDDDEEANSADSRIDLLRRELRLAPKYEFRFNKSSSGLRQAFLKALAPYNFFFYGIAINKDPSKLWGEGFKFKEPFYKYASGLVFENAKAVLDNATVIIDGSGSRDFRRQLQSYLKKRTNNPNQRSIKSLKVQDSARNNLLQLADMIAGAIYRNLGQKPDAPVYWQIISHRAMSVQVWPK